LKTTNAAKQKNVSRAAVLFAAIRGRIDMVEIDGTPHVINNDKFHEWTPRVKDPKACPACKQYLKKEESK